MRTYFILARAMKDGRSLLKTHITLYIEQFTKERKFTKEQKKLLFIRSTEKMILKSLKTIAPYQLQVYLSKIIERLLRTQLTSTPIKTKHYRRSIMYILIDNS